METDFWQAYYDDGLRVNYLMAKDYYGYPAGPDFLEDWINTYNLTYPVLADHNYAVSSMYNNTDFYIPFYWIVDQDMVIYAKTGWLLDPMYDIVEEILGISE